MQSQQDLRVRDSHHYTYRLLWTSSETSLPFLLRRCACYFSPLTWSPSLNQGTSSLARQSAQGAPMDIIGLSARSTMAPKRHLPFFLELRRGSSGCPHRVLISTNESRSSSF